MSPISNEEIKALGAAIKGRLVYLIKDHNEFSAGTPFVVKAAMYMPQRLTYKYLLTIAPADPAIQTDKVAVDNGTVTFTFNGDTSPAPVPAESPAPVAAPSVPVAAVPAPSAAPAVAPPSEQEFELSLPDDPEMEAAVRFAEKAPDHRLSQVFYDEYANSSGPFDIEPLDALEVECGTVGKDSWTLADVARLYFRYCANNKIDPDPLLYEVNKALEAPSASSALVEKPRGKVGRPPGSKNKLKETESTQPEFTAAAPTPAGTVVQFPNPTPGLAVSVPNIPLIAAPVAAELLKAAQWGASLEEIAATAVAMAAAALAATSR